MDEFDDLRAFVAARGAALSRTAYLLTGDRQSAEDLVQETYVDTVRRWGKIDSENPEAYVRRIMYSRFVDGLRRRRVVELPSAATPDVPGEDVMEASTIDRLTLAAALDQITPHQRAMLVLRFYDDLTETQTAEALRVSQSTVKSQTRLALRRLRELAPSTVAAFSTTMDEVSE